MAEIDFLAGYQKTTTRDYVARVVSHDKAECAIVARQWGADYWDGDRRYGYGGYHYDGRWRPIAMAIAAHYRLKPGDRVLDVGCGKAFLLYELAQLVPGLSVAGLDISHYGLTHAREEMRPFLTRGHANHLPWPDHTFDFVLSINTFHNLEVFDLEPAVREVQRVGKGPAWICVESFRSEQEKVNLLYWQLTCMSFYSPQSWRFLYEKWHYAGDYGFIYFE
ncbi:MAG: class I SAM-dependent methyltransferase [Azospirillaceae bacterium]|nr:class I SAM-dependent methyltransferase [Azospirillaceae bacterium]